jgi:hypothetical protein
MGPPLPTSFNLVMDVLHLMIEKSTADALFLGLANTSLQHCTLMYTDDVVTFIQPTWLDL